MDYTYSSTDHRYRDADGRLVSLATLLAWRGTARAKLEDDITALTERLAKGEITIQYWESQVQALVMTALGADFLLGIGGRNIWSATDKRALAELINDQYAYLREFVRDIAKGDMSEKAIAARTRMYIRAANTAFNQAKARSWNIDLPGWPGIGTICLSNCGCDWAFSSETEDDGTEVVIASWKLGKIDNCQTCLTRTHEWAHLRYVVE